MKLMTMREQYEYRDKFMKRNINEVISKFKNDQQDIQHRYYSFDFCYFHFRYSIVCFDLLKKKKYYTELSLLLILSSYL